jgi:hypothetical protein
MIIEVSHELPPVTFEEAVKNSGYEGAVTLIKITQGGKFYDFPLFFNTLNGYEAICPANKHLSGLIDPLLSFLSGPNKSNGID